MPVPAEIIEKTKEKYPTDYCLFLKKLFPTLDVSKCKAYTERIITERWAPNWEAGLRGFAVRMGALPA